MKILHVLSSSKLSGAENVAADICMMFQGVHDMTYCSPDGEIKSALADRDVKFIALTKLNTTELKRSIEICKPDIIHAHDVRATVLSVYVSGKIPVISHLHGNIEDMRKIGIKSILYMFAAKKLKKIIVVSESCLDDYFFRKQIERKTICLTNIIYFRRIERLIDKDPKEYNFDFMYIGRLCYPKNPQRVAKIASVVLRQCSTTTFGVIGEGELKNEMETVFRKEGVSDRATFTGQLAFPYKVLKQTKCILMCSRFEGTPIAALEAMALGIPIVSTPVDGMVKLIDDGITGYLSDDDATLSDRVITVIKEEQLRAQLSKNAEDKIKKSMDIQKYCENLLKVYTEAVQ